MNSLGANPYVGPRAFKEGEKLFGRDQEVQRLLNLIIAERVVILYSPSGAGKTSLIQAALIPELKKQNFRILGPMRVGRELAQEESSSFAENRYLSSLLLSLDYQPPAGQQVPQNLAGCLEQLAGDTDTPADEVLIFDQFEEILTLDPTDIEAKQAFFTQVGEVLKARYRWALFALREEYLAALEPYAHLIPTRFQNSFRLDLLSIDAAREAIWGLADKAGVKFTHGAGEDADKDDAAKKLALDLGKVRVQQPDGSFVEQPGPYVEPVHLQVVCQRLWEKHQTAWENLPPADRKITEQDLEKFEDVNTALGQYYQDKVAAVARDTKVPERELREWFDQRLITSRGLRGQVLLGETKLDEEAIRALVDAHLVRRDRRHGAIWFELAHDRLIRPIRANNEAWFQEHLETFQLQADLWNKQDKLYDLLLTGQEYTKAEQWAASHQDQVTDIEWDFLSRSKDKYARNRRNRRLTIGVFIFSVIAIVACVIALVFKNRADQQARLAMTRQFASSAFSQLALDPERSILLALEGVQEASALKETYAQPKDPEVLENIISTSCFAENALHRAMFTSRIISTFPDDQSGARQPQRGKVTQVFFSSDCQRLAMVGLDNSVKIWDGAAKQFLDPPEQVEVTRAAFTRDGRRLALACQDAAKIWEVDKKTMVSIPHDKKVIRVYFNQEGTYLATVDTDDDVRLYDAETLTPLLSRPLHHEDLTDLAFSPDGTYVATAGWDGHVFFWEFPSGKKLQTIAPGGQRIYLSPHGTLLATISSVDGLVKLWKLSSAPELIWAGEGKNFDVKAAVFSPDDTLLALASKNDHVVYVLNTTTGNYQAILPGHTGRIAQLYFLPQGSFFPTVRFLISASDDATLKMWDIVTNRELFSLAGQHTPIVGFAVYPNPEKRGERLVSVGWYGRAKVWDIGIGHTSFVNEVAFNAAGTWLATASNDGTARLWDTRDGHELFRCGGDQDRVAAMAFSHHPRHDELVTAGTTEFLKFWAPGEQEPRHTINCNDILAEIAPHLRPKVIEVSDMIFSPQGKYAAVQAVVGFALRYRTRILLFTPDQAVGAEPPRLIPPLSHPDLKFSCMAISPQEDHLAVGLKNGKMQIWEIKGQSEPLEFKAHGDAVLSVAYSPTGNYLASAGADMMVKLWKWNPNANKWDQVKTKKNLPAFTNVVDSVVFSRDGKLLAAGSKDRTTKVFDLEGQVWHSFSHPNGINGVAFNPDPDSDPHRNQLATACDDNRWYLHPLVLKVAIAEAKKKVTRQLTDAECRMYDIRRASTPGRCDHP